MKKRLLACLLTAAMLVSLFPLPALAAEAEPYTGGLCPHHTEHSYEVCGYVEAVEGQHCGYICPTCSMQAMNDLPTPLADETGDFTVTGDILGTEYTYNADTKTLTVSTSGTYTITGTGVATTDKIVIADGVTADVTLQNVSIDVSGTDYACAFQVAGSAICNLTLTGVNTLKSGRFRAGLKVQSGATLTIDGEGTITATGGDWGAGIGGGWGGSGGTININGGTVNATGGDGAAGIGGGNGGDGGTVTINGGTVTATGGWSGGNRGTGGAGIGGGCDGDGGTVTINNGIVTAAGGDGAGGIGGGGFWSEHKGRGGTTIINGGTVTATSIGGGGYYRPYSATSAKQSTELAAIWA